jgi:hypothetical protein
MFKNLNKPHRKSKKASDCQNYLWCPGQKKRIAQLLFFYDRKGPTFSYHYLTKWGRYNMFFIML